MALTYQKTFFIALFICFIGRSSFAQTTENHGYIGYSVGPSFHVGNLGYISPDNKREQFAKSGYFINYVNFGYLIKNKKNLGLTASVFYGETVVDNSNENDWWVIMGITAGPVLSFVIVDKLHLDFKFEFGRAGTINYIYPNYIYHGLLHSGDFGGGWAMDYCTTVRYNIYKRLCLLLEVGYTTTNQIYPDKREVKIQEIYSGLGVVFLLKSREKKDAR